MLSPRPFGPAPGGGVGPHREPQRRRDTAAIPMPSGLFSGGPQARHHCLSGISSPPGVEPASLLAGSIPAGHELPEDPEGCRISANGNERRKKGGEVPILRHSPVRRCTDPSSLTGPQQRRLSYSMASRL